MSVIKRGRILFEMSGVDQETAKEAMRLAAYKLPFATRFVVKEAAYGESKEKELETVES